MRRPVIFALALTLAFAASLAARAPAQDDPDVFFGWEPKCVDIAYADDGTAVVAFAHPSNVQDEIIVRSSQDLGQTWQTLYVNVIGQVRTIEQVSVACASGGPAGTEDRVFVGILGTWDDPANPMAFRAILSGPSSKNAWTWSQCLDVDQVQYTRYDPSLTIDCAVIPLVDVHPPEYAVGLAYDWILGSSRSVLTSWTLDHGATLHGTNFVAGDGGATLDSTNRYGVPSLTANTRDREVLLALHDEDAETVFVLHGSARNHIEFGDPLQVYHETPRGGDREHHPVIDCYDGSFNMTCLLGDSTMPGDTYDLTWFHGDTLLGTMRELRDPNTGGPVARGVLSRADLVVRRGDAYFTALTEYQRDGDVISATVIAFEGDRRDGLELTQTRVNDRLLAMIWTPDPRPLAPRVGVAPVTASPRRAQSYAWILPTVVPDVVIDP